MKRKKVFLWTGAALVVIAGLAGWRFLGHTKVKSAYETYTVSRGDMENSVTATGTVKPMEQVEVGTQVSGIIYRIYVDYNSEVKKGEIIAELDKTVLQTELDAARLSVESNKNEFLYQEKNYKRNKALYEKKLISPSEFETVEYTYEKAKIAYQQSVAQEQKAKTNLGYATIYSPIDGVVISRAVEVGQTVASSFSTPTLFTIANDLHSVQVVADVDEADIGQVAEGEEVTFTVDAYPDMVFEGKVNQVRMDATTTNNVVTYQVVIHAQNPDLKLKPGLTANISIYSMRKLGVLRVPVKATRFTPDNFETPARAGHAPHLSDSAGKRPSSHPASGPRDSTRRNHPADRHGRPDNAKRPDRARFMADSIRDEENVKIVFVLPQTEPDHVAEPEMRKVKVGVTDRIYYEVLHGLKEGDVVCVGIQTQAPGKAKISQQQSSPFMPTPPGRKR